MKVKIGDLFYFDVAYSEDPSKYSNRPVLVLDEIEGCILLLISTTTKGRKFPIRDYDSYKIPIQNWRKTGLTKPSWVRGKILISLPKEEVESLVKAGDFIGRMHPEDFNFIIDELKKIHSD